MRALPGNAMHFVSKKKAFQLGALELERSVQSSIGPNRGTALVYGQKGYGNTKAETIRLFSNMHWPLNWKYPTTGRDHLDFMLG